MNNHPYHMVENSPWPLIMSMSLMSIMLSMIMIFHKMNYLLMIFSLLIMTLTMYQWLRDMTRESTFQGLHTKKVMMNLKMGMILFISTEVMFFMSFFWAFFHSSLSPNIEIGINWPPTNIKTFNPIGIPMLNTIILISSGMSITWAHSSIINNNLSQAIKSLNITIMLGIYFSTLQMFEYLEAPFCMSDSIYGSTFFMSTGFHGIHVVVGSVFISISTLRFMKLHFNKLHHVGLECSIWYWHFVDVVWMFLYISIYWWGS